MLWEGKSLDRAPWWNLFNFFFLTFPLKANNTSLFEWMLTISLKYLVWSHFCNALKNTSHFPYQNMLWGRNWNFFFFLSFLWICVWTLASFCFTIIGITGKPKLTPAVSTNNKRFSQSNHTERFKFLSLSLRFCIADFLSQRF